MVFFIKEKDILQRTYVNVVQQKTIRRDTITTKKIKNEQRNMKMETKPFLKIL